MMRANILVCSTPSQHGGRCGAIIDGELLPFQYDGKKLYYNIAKPTDQELDTLQWFKAPTSTHNATNPDCKAATGYSNRRMAEAA